MLTTETIIATEAAMARVSGPSSARIEHVIATLRRTEPHLAGRLTERLSVKLCADTLEDVAVDVRLLEQTQADLLEDIRIKRATIWNITHREVMQ